MDYQCSKCSTRERPTRARLVVWRRDEGYLCAVCAGSPNELLGPVRRCTCDSLTETPREFGHGPFNAFTRRQAEAGLAAVSTPTNVLKTAMSRREEAEERFRALQDAPSERREIKKGYQGFRLPNDPRRS